MQDGHRKSAAAIVPVLGRVAAALCLAVVFNVVCFGLLQWSEPYLSHGAVRFMTRVVWWPVVISCGTDSSDLFCALPGMVSGFLFHWLVAFGLLWWHKRPRPAGGIRSSLT